MFRYPEGRVSGGRYIIWRRGRVSRGVYTLNPPTTKAGGTHHTGMFSCSGSVQFFVKQRIVSVFVV